MPKTILERVQITIAEYMGIDESRVIPDAKITDDLGADSLDTVELCMVLEEEFDVEIPDDILPTLITVRDVVNYIEAL